MFCIYTLFVVRDFKENIASFFFKCKTPKQYKPVINNVFIPHATSCGGYNFFDPSVSQSVSQSVSPVFLVSAAPLKPLDRIS